MYAKAKSCINKDNLISGYFPSNIGVRQGDNLSPLLFALFINDCKHSIANTYPGLNIADSSYPTLNDNSMYSFDKNVCIIICWRHDCTRWKRTSTLNCFRHCTLILHIVQLKCQHKWKQIVVCSREKLSDVQIW